MVRRQNPDPLLLQTVSARLARLLEENAPPDRAAVPGSAPPDLASGGSGPSSPGPASTALEGLDDLPAPPRFRRIHVGVVTALLLVGLLWAGWSLLRARPVPVAAAPGVVVSPAGREPSTTAAATSPTTRERGSSASPSGTASGRLVVHVLGAVRSPGLVTLPLQARVQDAVDATGGFTRRADAGELNLAQVLQDGEQVVIGTADHPDGEVRGSSGSGGGSAGTPGTGSAGAGVMDLNQADATQLEELPGVGPVTAGAIVAWRTEHGRFGKVEELQEVDGIGPKTYAQIAPHVRV